MKKMFAVLTLLSMAGAAQANISKTTANNQYKFDVPHRFSSSSDTDTMEWGCPISEVIHAKTTEEAMERIGASCMEDVKQAAIEKPGVFDVINVSVIWPDVKVSQTLNGYKLEGTLFLETLVMKGSKEVQ